MTLLSLPAKTSSYDIMWHAFQYAAVTNIRSISCLIFMCFCIMRKPGSFFLAPLTGISSLSWGCIGRATRSHARAPSRTNAFEKNRHFSLKSRKLFGSFSEIKRVQTLKGDDHFEDNCLDSSDFALYDMTLWHHNCHYVIDKPGNIFITDADLS